MYLTILRVIHFDNDQRRTDQMMLMSYFVGVFFFLIFFIKAYVVGTHLNCIDKSLQFKWVPKTYAFIKKYTKSTLAVI